MRFLWILWSYRESGKPIELPLWSPNRKSQLNIIPPILRQKSHPLHSARLQMTPLSWATWAISRLCSWLCGAYSRKNHPQWRCLKMFEWEDNPQMEFVGHFQFLVVRFFSALGCGRSIMSVNIMISLIRTFIPIKVVLQSISYITTSCPCCWYIILGFSCLLFCKFCHWHIKHHQVGILYFSVISN